MKWATRAACEVDRVASAWLISRFVDSDAEFIYLESHEQCPADATPFDIPGVELSHHRGGCTFESVLEKYALRSPALDAMSRLVHEADLEDGRFDEPTAAGLAAIIAGLGFTHPDREVVALGAEIMEGLYAAARRDHASSP